MSKIFIPVGMKEIVKRFKEPSKSQFSPKIYDLRTPLKKSVGRENTEIVVFTDSFPSPLRRGEGFGGVYIL